MVPFAPPSCLPGLSTACAARTAAIESALPPGTHHWPFIDRVLAWLVPDLVADIEAFHAGTGATLPALLKLHQIEHLDGELATALAERVPAPPTLEPTPPVMPKAVRVAAVALPYGTLLISLGLVLQSRLARETAPRASEAEAQLRSTVTALLSQASQRRVIDAILGASATDPLQFTLLRTELTAVAASWVDIQALDRGDLRARAELTLLLHAGRALHLLLDHTADAPSAERRALRVLGRILTTVASSGSPAV
jgi:hypothetical protein